MRCARRRAELGAAGYVRGLKMLEEMNKMERIENYNDSIKVSQWHPHSVGEVERREQLEVIRRVIGLLERVVPERFPRVREKKGVAGCT
jgi:hypothetical protein